MKTPLGAKVDLSPGHTVLDGVQALRETGTAAPCLFGPCLLWPRSPISATAELLLLVNTLAFISEKMQLIIFCLSTFNFYSLEFCLILLASVSDFVET